MLEMVKDGICGLTIWSFVAFWSMFFSMRFEFSFEGFMQQVNP